MKTIVKFRGQGAFEYVLLVGLVLALVVGIIFVLRGGLAGSGSQVATQQCLAQLASDPYCYNSTGGWVPGNNPVPTQYNACSSSSATTAHGTGASPNFYCGPKPA
ncbi:MAG TPA: hypothetical protein VGQ00_01985 [Candidatus Norongarragalinales archaeon]|nr:hypothetical protein [Candidatus Norongarragalinales archaeon]